MSILSSPQAIWALIAIQILGIACTWAARACEGSAGQTICQALFFVFLALVGIQTMFTMELSTGLWLSSGATLGAMVVGATCSGRRSEQAFAS